MAAPQAIRPKPDGFFRTLWRVIRAVFHETTGALFFVLALSWASATLRLWRTGMAEHWVLAMAGGFVILLTAFGITSFRAARRVR